MAAMPRAAAFTPQAATLRSRRSQFPGAVPRAVGVAAAATAARAVRRQRPGWWRLRQRGCDTQWHYGLRQHRRGWQRRHPSGSGVQVGNGGNGQGGGVYANAAVTVTGTGVTVVQQLRRGWQRRHPRSRRAVGNGGNGQGGGVYANAAVTLTGTTVSSNLASRVADGHGARAATARAVAFTPTRL